MHITIPQPRNFALVKGTDINTNFDFGGSDGSEAKKLKDITQTIERFEIGHGYQSGGVHSFGGDEYIYNETQFDEPSQHSDIDHSSNNTRTTQSRDIDRSENKKENYDNIESDDNESDDVESDDVESDNDENDEDIVEHFNGSLIVEEEERVLLSKCILVAILFIIVNHTFWDKYIAMMSERLMDYIIIVKAIFFCILFYLTEKFLLK